jgi:hypothetical protein
MRMQNTLIQARADAKRARNRSLSGDLFKHTPKEIAVPMSSLTAHMREWWDNVSIEMRRSATADWPLMWKMAYGHYFLSRSKSTEIAVPQPMSSTEIAVPQSCPRPIIKSWDVSRFLRCAFAFSEIVRDPSKAALAKNDFVNEIMKQSADKRYAIEQYVFEQVRMRTTQVPTIPLFVINERLGIMASNIRVWKGRPAIVRGHRTLSKEDRILVAFEWLCVNG